jgi:hypothetical protein
VAAAIDDPINNERQIPAARDQARDHMSRFKMKSAAVLCGTLLTIGSILALAPRPAFAANSDAPYTNVDPRNDRGNDTGDSQVDGLNKSQTDRNYWPDAQRQDVPNPPYYTNRH